jgi:hypothetical protein
LRRFDFGRQNVPVLIAERLRDQLESFGMYGFDNFCFEGLAQSARHSFRVAEIAHESTFFIGKRKRSGPALPTPFANGEGAAENRSDTFAIPKRPQAARVPAPTHGVARDRDAVHPERCDMSAVCRYVELVASTGARRSIVGGASVKDVRGV